MAEGDTDMREAWEISFDLHLVEANMEARCGGLWVRDINGKIGGDRAALSLCERGVGFGLHFGEVLEVGVLEVGGVFEAVAEEAVEGYVGYPDEGDGGG